MKIMRNWIIGLTSVVVLVAVFGLGLTRVARTESVTVPSPAVDAQLAASGSPNKVAVVAGGCFWGIQAVYQHVRGVKKAVSGYAGGAANTAHYEMVGTGRTGHAESVQIFYDPAVVSYGQLLRVFFSVAHDPTTLNRQGPDDGPQYRSAIFVQDAEQEKIARAYIAQLDQARVFRSPIVTDVTKLPAFYDAEDYHQDYATLHPRDSYIMINDAPKVANLQTLFPDLYVEPGKRR
jgi:peptide-methionine (S)-S-oxide reductase